MKKIAVCGGAGEIGWHLCKKLRDSGAYVTVYDRKYPVKGKQFSWPANEYFVFDLTNDQDYFASFRFHEYDEVYHLAGSTRAAPEHAEVMYNRARTTLNILEVCRKAKVKVVHVPLPGTQYGDEDWLLHLYEAYADQYGMDIQTHSIEALGAEIANVAATSK